MGLCGTGVPCKRQRWHAHKAACTLFTRHFYSIDRYFALQASWTVCLLASLSLAPCVLTQVAVPDDVSDEAAAQFWVSISGVMTSLVDGVSLQHWGPAMQCASICMLLALMHFLFTQI